MGSRATGVTAANSIARVNRGYQALTGLVLTVFWIAPMIWVACILWREPAPLLTAVTVLVMPGCLLATKLPDGWFRPRAWEIDGRVYTFLGVHQFNWLVVDGEWMNRRIRRAIPAYRRFATMAGLRELKRATKPAEIVHWTWLFASLPPLASALLVGEFVCAAVLGAGNVLVNLYPIGLQRALRARAETLSRRRQPSP